MQQIKVFISAKLGHARKLSQLRTDGFHINARWIEMADSGRQRLKPVTHWQQENFDDIRMAHFFIMYVEPSDRLKGSLFEIGHAVGIGKQCWIAGNGQSVEATPEGASQPINVPHKDVLPWGLYRPQIRVVPTLEQALLEIAGLVRPAQIMELDGSLTAPPEF